MPLSVHIQHRHPTTTGMGFTISPPVRPAQSQSPQGHPGEMGEQLWTHLMAFPAIMPGKQESTFQEDPENRQFLGRTLLARPISPSPLEEAKYYCSILHAEDTPALSLVAVWFSPNSFPVKPGQIPCVLSTEGKPSPPTCIHGSGISTVTLFPQHICSASHVEQISGHIHHTHALCSSGCSPQAPDG